MTRLLMNGSKVKHILAGFAMKACADCRPDIQAQFDEAIAAVGAATVDLPTVLRDADARARDMATNADAALVRAESAESTIAAVRDYCEREPHTLDVGCILSILNDRGFADA